MITLEMEKERFALNAQVDADILALSLANKIEKTLEGNERYLILLEGISVRRCNDAPLCFFLRDFQHVAVFDCIQELSCEGLLNVKEEKDSCNPIGRGPYTSIIGITYKGRMELARLEREKREASRWYKSKGYVWTGICFVAGSLVSAFIGYLFR